METCIPHSIQIKRAQEEFKNIDAKIKQKHRKLITLSRKLAPGLKSRKTKDKRNIKLIKSLFNEIKDLSVMKNDSWKYNISLIEKEIKKVNSQIEIRENYLINNGVYPNAALEYLNNREKAEFNNEDLWPKQYNIITEIVNTTPKPNKFKGRQGLDINIKEDSLMTNSDSYAYSSTQLKSPSRVEIFSWFENSPAIKRFKVSDEEEKQSIKNDNFKLNNNNYGESSSTQPLRKSTRKRTKSKILREAIGEIEEERQYTVVKKRNKTKGNKSIAKLMEADQFSNIKEEPIPLHKNCEFMLEYQHDLSS